MLLPRCFSNTRYFTFVCQVSEAYTTYSIFFKHCMWSSTYRASCIFTCFILLRSLLFYDHSFSCHAFVLLKLFCKRHTHQAKKFSCFFVCLGSRYKYYIHTSCLVYLVEFYFREYKLLFNSKSVVSSSVK